MALINTTGKEFFYEVSGLKVPKYMVSENLTGNIDHFVDWVTVKANSLIYLVSNNMETFVSEMKNLYSILCSIHAQWLEIEAARILRMTEIEEFELCIKLAAPFVSNLQTLAIDIQMAQHTGFENRYNGRDELEKCKNVISSLKVVATLLDNEDFEKALDVALGIDELQDGVYAIPFISALTSKNKSLTQKLINEVIHVYSKKVDASIAAVANMAEMKKIVVVDDMPEILTAINYMLQDHYQTFLFTSGAEALEFIDEEQRPDAFLLDIDMPGMDGFLLAKHIRSRPIYERTSILFLTSNSNRENVMRSALYGAKAFIVKPANKDIIISKLASCLSKW